MCDIIYKSMFDFLDKVRGQMFSGRTCYAVAEVRSPSNTNSYDVIVTQNGASGLMNGGARNLLNVGGTVKFFSVSDVIRGNYIRIEPSDQIKRVPNRHAEMNIVMYCLAQFLSENPYGKISKFSFDTYCRAINPSLTFCPECQLALALLSKPAATLIGSISQLIRESSNPPVLLLRGSGRLSPNWPPPWTTYFEDVPGSDFFNQLRQNGNLTGEYSIGYNGSNGKVVIFQKDGDRWSSVKEI